MPSFYNTPMQPTKPTVTAPPINEYREALYDEALPDDPAARMQEMKGRFDRLVRELGVSPRGPPPSTGTSKFNTASSPRLPKVPSSKAWGSTRLLASWAAPIELEQSAFVKRAQETARTADYTEVQIDE